MNRKENAFDLLIILPTVCVLVMFHVAYVFTGWQLHHFVLLEIQLHTASSTVLPFASSATISILSIVLAERSFMNLHKRSMACSGKFWQRSTDNSSEISKYHK